MDHDQLNGDTIRDTLTLPGRLTLVPEFHDCQRFIVNRGTRRAYDSLHAIWVRDSLEFVQFPLASGGIIPPTADSVGTVNAAGEVPFRIGDSLLVASGLGTRRTGVAVALVYSTGPHPPLGLEPGFNCLYLYDPGAWKAIMVPVNAQEHCSSENIEPANAQGTVLQVREIRARGLRNQDYPPVARWDADVRDRYFIGIKCLGAWCEIGSNVGQSPAYGGGRTRAVKGWYDEQYLAIVTVKDIRRPTGMLGTLFPDPQLDELVKSGYQPGVWYRVASAALRNGPGRAASTKEYSVYQTKFGFRQGAVQTGENEIYFCDGTSVDCRVPETLRCTRRDGQQAQSQERRYWARIVSVAKDTTYRCVTYTDHGITMPGVVRWRWLANDEKTWVSCPNGCCQVDW